ncbi:MAG: peptide chain release factor-like protein [Actinobacteria bacterium]|nr:peptide chain release factor-like protein [Actinomycetota bacterium]|tara:strand:+ start:1043 stop:1408 length:366 start_codon:yes stop_codon:yes gene_type:complete
MSLPSPEKQAALQQRMASLGIRDKDLSETFVLGSGKGGQKQNKTHSCVQLQHIPSQTQVSCQKSRSREMNRFLARRQLCEAFENKQLGKASPKQQEIDKIRKQKKRRKRRVNNTATPPEKS